MAVKLTLTVKGDIEKPHGEHFTSIKKSNGDELNFYTDGYEGISYSMVVEILKFLEVDYFEVHKNFGGYKKS